MSKPPSKRKVEVFALGKSYIVYEYQYPYSLHYECHGPTMEVYQFGLLANGEIGKTSVPFNEIELALIEEIKKAFPKQ